MKTLQEILDGFSKSEVGTADNQDLSKIRIRTKIYEFNKQGEVIKVWKSREELARKTRIKFRDNKNGFLITRDQRIFSRQESHPDIQKILNKRFKQITQRICQYSLDGKLINEFPTVYTASKMTNIQITWINRMLKIQHTKRGKLITSNDSYFRYK